MVRTRLFHSGQVEVGQSNLESKREVLSRV